MRGILKHPKINISIMMTKRRDVFFATILSFVGLSGLAFAGLTVLLTKVFYGELGGISLFSASAVLGAGLFMIAFFFNRQLTRYHLQRVNKKLAEGPSEREISTRDASDWFTLDERIDRILLQGAITGKRCPNNCGASSKPVNSTMSNRDSQDSRRARVTSELFQQAFDSAPVGLGVFRVESGQFVEANRSFLGLTGFSREELLARSDLQLGLWESAAARRRLLDHLADSGSLGNVECRLRSKPGPVRHTLAWMNRLDVMDDPCVLVVFQDMMMRLNLESQLCQNQKMEAVGRLAAGLAHDFNNILTIVQGHTSLLLANPELDRKCTAALESVSVAAERAATLTRQLLAFSRKQVMHPKTLSLNEMAEGLAHVLRQLLGERINLKLRVMPDLPMVQADPAMMEQVIMSLVTNARDALPQGGVVEIATNIQQIDEGYVQEHTEARPGNFVCLSVQDNGVGMDAATMNRIFEPFFTTKGVGKGAGLGLATVYGVVKQQNGWIDVKSQPGQGTTFRIFLQASKATTHVARNQNPCIPPGKNERILIVEDEPSLRSLVYGILQRYGYDVATASNGVEAIQVWEKEKASFDLLLTDMVMPEGVTGRALADRLRTQKPELKVIYTSGYSADLLGDEMDGLIEGVNFLQKPYRPHSLAQTVRSCLENIPQTSGAGAD